MELNPIIVMLAMYGTWHLVGRFARWILRRPLRPSVTTVVLPAPDYSVRRSAQKLYDQHQYIRRLEKQG